MNYIVSYDISCDINRKKLSSFLIESGLTRIQYSIFHGNFSLKKRDFLLEGCKKFFHKSSDSIAFIPLCIEDLDRYISIGKERIVEKNLEIVKIV